MRPWNSILQRRSERRSDAAARWARSNEMRWSRNSRTSSSMRAPSAGEPGDGPGEVVIESDVVDMIAPLFGAYLKGAIEAIHKVLLPEDRHHQEWGPTKWGS